MIAALPPNEEARLKTLYRYNVLDTEPESALDDLTALVAHICGTPIALVSLVDADRQWFKSRFGLDIQQTSRDQAFCAHALLQPDDVMIVEDTIEDKRFSDNVLVTDKPQIRFYVGAPLIACDGHALGTLCAIDTKPRQLDESQIQAIRVLSNHVVTYLEVRRQEEARKRAEAHIHSILEATPNGLIMIDSQGYITLLNIQIEKLFGYSREELIGQNIDILVPERFRELHPHHRARYFSEPSTRAMGVGRDLYGQRKDGSEFPVEIGLNPLTTPEGLMVLASVVDISERKRLELLMNTKQKVLDMLGDGTNINIILNKIALGIEIYFTDLLCSIMLVDSDGVHFSTSVAPNLPEPFKLAMERVSIEELYGLREGENYCEQILVSDIAVDPFWAGFRELALDNGLYTCWSTRVFDTSCRLLGMIHLFSKKPYQPTYQDITTIEGFGNLISIANEYSSTHELRLAKESAEAADRLKSAFLATMSHELRTPLNSIIGFTGIILNGLAGPLNPEQTNQLGMVQSSARHLLALINDVLDISKIEAGQLTLSFDPFNLRDAITRMVDLVKPMADKKGLSMRIDLSFDEDVIISDQRRVEQIILNLLSNAIKFTENGSVVLEVTDVPDYPGRVNNRVMSAVSICVTDTGIGINPEDLTMIFNPFQQVETGLSQPVEGTGLGLAISKRLVDLLGGDIKAESEWCRGSRFTVTLPVKPPAEP